MNDFVRLLRPQAVAFIEAIGLLLFFALGIPETGRTGEESPAGRTEPIVYYDASSLLSLNLDNETERDRLYDESHLLASLQGLVNREAPRLFVRYHTGPDDFWWQRLREPGGWLHERDVRTIETLPELLRHFRSEYRGAVVWDERVPATSNLASTVAGCEQVLCLRYDEAEDSLCRRLTSGDLKLPVSIRLLREDGEPLFTGAGLIPETSLPSSGSAKADAYLWLIENYVKTGKTNPVKLGYYVDAFWLKCWQAGGPYHHTLMNHDYVIAHRGTFFDLHVWEDEAPVDDPGQKPGTDVNVLKQLLRACNDRTEGREMIHAAGFTPWVFKYTDYKSGRWDAGGRYGGVPTEWKYAEILSCFNAFMDADAIGPSSMANASFFQHQPVPERVPQNPKPSVETLREKGFLDAQGRVVPRNYVAHYVGDYDSAAWLYWMMPSLWIDPKRGEIPLSWAFNPNLGDRFPLGLLWTRQTRTENDFFVAGDSGAGYLNPGLLSEPRIHSELPSGWAVWEDHCRRYYEKWDLSLTGFVIDGNGPGLREEGLDAYARFSPHGIVPQKIPPRGVHRDMPFLRMKADLPDDPLQAARVIAGELSAQDTRFQVYRSILKSPAWYTQLQAELDQVNDKPLAVVDLYTLLLLVRCAEQTTPSAE